MKSEKFKDLRGFEVKYDTLVAGTSTLKVNNMSGSGLIALLDTDADGEVHPMILPKDVAIQLARFILSEFALTDSKGEETK